MWTITNCNLLLPSLGVKLNCSHPLWVMLWWLCLCPNNTLSSRGGKGQWKSCDDGHPHIQVPSFVKILEDLANILTCLHTYVSHMMGTWTCVWFDFFLQTFSFLPQSIVSHLVSTERACTCTCKHVHAWIICLVAKWRKFEVLSGGAVVTCLTTLADNEPKLCELLRHIQNSVNTVTRWTPDLQRATTHKKDGGQFLSYQSKRHIKLKIKGAFDVLIITRKGSIK